MSLPRSVAEILREHVTLEVESIDRLYLNAYAPRLQYESGVAAFFRQHRGHPFASSALMEPISKTFVAAIQAFVDEQGVPLVTFAKGQRKDDVMAEHLARFTGSEGVLFVGRAQEKTRVIRTEKRRNPTTGQAYPWLVRSTAMVNHFYFYGVDRDFGPFFLKFGTYFPYTAKLCLNGHEYVKRQLARREIAFEALDNGILSCANPRRLQALCDGLSAEKIDTFFRKWLHRLPHPFTRQDRHAGYRYELSILQAEFSLTQVLDRPLSGRLLFEDLIRENLDLGRPDRVQLIFDRRVTRPTPGRFRTRVLTDGVVPSLHVTYKHSDLKQDTWALDTSWGCGLNKERLLRAVSVRRDVDSEPGAAAFSGYHRFQSAGLDPMQDGSPAHPERVGRLLRREPALRRRTCHELPHGRPEPDAPGRPGRHLVADEQPVAQPAQHGEVADAELLRRLQGGVDGLRPLRERGLVLWNAVALAEPLHALGGVREARRRADAPADEGLGNLRVGHHGSHPPHVVDH